ncbi:hypothetical protein EJB05_49717 [Eragrostis curvula]|uniref:Uncharacterized protein n=1 Tax=Eragrostis curvula TaxID=38414 RepID=A0A5J9T5I7_9POAL|nr:hypothetical protein EJB05_49717 [Eragrostis curvula]
MQRRMDGDFLHEPLPSLRQAPTSLVGGGPPHDSHQPSVFPAAFFITSTRHEVDTMKPARPTPKIRSMSKDHCPESVGLDIPNGEFDLL